MQSVVNKEKEQKAETFCSFWLFFSQNAETDIAIITDAVNTPEIRAADTISHLFDSRKRFIYKLSPFCPKAKMIILHAENPCGLIEPDE